MQSLFENPAFKVYALSAAVISIQLLLLAFWTGTVRAMRKQFVNPEDAALNKAPQVENDHPDVLRVKRAHQNLIENAIPFLAVGLLYVLKNPTAKSAQIYCFTFVGARLLHTLFYLLGKQPFRTIMFAIGALTTIGMAVQVLLASL